MTVDVERLRRLLGGPELARLRARLRRALEADARLPATLTLKTASDSERAAIDSLLGRAPSRGVAVQLCPQVLDTVLQNAGLPDLRTALVLLEGPLRDLPVLAAQKQTAWAAVFANVQAQATALGLTNWLDDVQASGLLKRLTSADPLQAAVLLEGALRVAAALPGGGMTLSTLAATVLHDAHALDAGRPLAALARQVAARLGQSVDDGTPEGTRAIWAAVGIRIGGDLTSTVLMLNVPAVGNTTTGQLAARLAEAGEPIWLTLRQLLRETVAWQVAGMEVYVCENPAVVAAAADTLGAGCRPLVCTYGQPVAAVMVLLRQLQAAGAQLYYHGDFDWPGIRIANYISILLTVRSWRFDAEAYAAAPLTGAALIGEPVAACWDEQLLPIMQAHNRRVEEEQVLDNLLADLRR